MNDLFAADDFFTGIDLIEDPLAAGDVPLDMPAAAATDVAVDTAWFDPGLPDLGVLPDDLALPDPFVGGTGLGTVGALGGLIRRRGGGGSQSGQPSQPGMAVPPSRIQTAATAAQLADTAASLVQRVAGFKRKRAEGKPKD